MVSISQIKKGLYRFKEANQGWVISIKGASELIKAAEKARDSKKVTNFDCFSPFPIHGLEKAMGLERSWLPLFTLIFALFGCFAAVGLMFYVDVIDWPINIGGKPSFAWPGYVPVTFEITILLGGLASAAAVIYLGRLGNTSRKPPIESVTSDGFAIWIEDELSEQEVKTILGDFAGKIKPIKNK